MTHPVYSARFLSAKGIVRLRKIAKELGVTPSDGRSIRSHVDAIVAHQASKVQKIEAVEPVAARIEYSDGIEECELESYSVIVGENVVCGGFKSYSQAENWITRNGYKLVDPQEIAQAEFEQHLENLQLESEKEVIDDYLFHDDIVLERGSGRDKEPQVGDVFVAGSFILKCVQISTPGCATVWDVYQGNQLMGEISCNYSGLWITSLSISLLTTPYEAVAELVENAYELAGK
jgi:hypothetical protein